MEIWSRDFSVSHIDYLTVNQLHAIYQGKFNEASYTRVSLLSQSVRRVRKQNSGAHAYIVHCVEQSGPAIGERGYLINAPLIYVDDLDAWISAC